MTTTHPQVLPKRERISSRKTIDRLFGGHGSRAMTAFPLRVVYTCTEAADTPHDPPAQMMVSVPKRHIRHAVGRNRIKRQVREAYRRQRHLLDAALADKPGTAVRMAFIWLDSRTRDTGSVERHVGALLQRISERL